eukprot:TRINITY_DN19828_c1_g1_i1.p1 TRINITY_DN19828_c1_g1~~TRINITY_DN19828_c1_g1_i1.p1  ORF type:complete len:343 (-),score=66.06 TRINITY_DN19828_c1_g1_i1:109-1137(-)
MLDRALLPKGIGLRSTEGAGEEAFSNRSAKIGEILIEDQPFAVLKAPLPKLPEQLDQGVSADDLKSCLHSVGLLRQSLKELCAAIVGYQPPEPKEYWNSLLQMSCPAIDMPHPVMQEISKICSFLSQKGRSAGLFSHWPDSSPEAVMRTVLIWMTNCLPYKGKSALFPLASKVNHACKSNVLWNPDAGSFVAIRSISEGESLCMSYLQAADEVTFRRCSLLYQQFFFWCHCATCEADRHWSDPCDSEKACHAEIRIAQALLKGGMDAGRAKPLQSLAKSAGLSPDHFVVKELCRYFGKVDAGQQSKESKVKVSQAEDAAEQQNVSSRRPETASQNAYLEELD